MPTPNGPHNQPRYDVNDDADFAADLTVVSDYAAKVGNIRTGTTAERNSLAGLDVWPGLLWSDSVTGVLYRSLNGTWNQLTGTYTGTNSTGIGSNAAQGVGAFSKVNNASSADTSFLSMGGDGRFTLAAGSYVMTVTMVFGGSSRATGRTFVEIIDSGDTGTAIGRGSIPPNVGEDTTSAALTTYTNGTRVFRVQCLQNSGGPSTILFRLAVTKTG